MYVMTVTYPDGRVTKMLASGLFEYECDRYRAHYEAMGCTVTFGYEVWK